MKRSLILTLSVLVGVGAATAQVAVLGEDDLDGFEFTGDSGGKLETETGVLRVAADSGAAAVIGKAVEVGSRNGDVHLASFSVRAPAGSASPEVRFAPGLSSYSAALRMPAPAVSGWTRYQYPFKVRRDYAPGEARLEFRVPEGETVEIRGLELLHHGGSKSLLELPCTRLDYAGSEPDAPWRREAAERIEKIRKAELRITVTDRSGDPLKGAEVGVKLKRHEFGFGTTVNVPTFHNMRNSLSGEDVSRYRSEIERLFSRVVFENATKWPAWEMPEMRRKTLETVAWMRERGLPVRGHVLIWPSWRWLPKRLREFRDDPQRLRRESLEHIRDEVTSLRGQVAEWDVVNEPFTNHDLMDIIGDEVMVEWFAETRKLDPEGLLFINDFGILSGNNDKHRDHYEKTIAYLIRNGAPLDGIGLQGHFSAEVTPPEKLLATLDRYARFGKALQVTEFDIDTVDLRLQADYTRDAMTVMFSHPAVTGFLMWGFWEGRHWKPNGAMYWKDWSPQPNAEAYEKLVFNEWWTEEFGRTGSDGRFRVRGFLGSYDVRVRSGGEERTFEVKLPSAGADIRLEL